MTLVAGSYERFLFGYSCSQNGQNAELARTFTHAAHQGVVKALSTAGPYLASGGADDLIHIYDLKNDKDLGFLVNPGVGPITALHFVTAPGAYTPSHLLAGAADGTISVWRVGGGWECMKSMKGHRREVTAISPHPSGKIALTTSRDGSLRMWDLVKGRAAFTTKVETEVDDIAFDAAGEQYAMLSGTAVTLHTVNGSVVSKMEHPRKVLCMCWAGENMGNNMLITGAEDGSLRVWEANTGKEKLCIQRAHKTRIKAVTTVLQGCIASASSDGVIKLWNLSGKSEGVESIAEVATRARLTVICGADSPDQMAEKMKQHKDTVQQTKKHKKRKQNAEETSVPKKQQQQGANSNKKQKGNATAAETNTTNANKPTKKEDVVSFIDDKDREKMKKKQRQVQIHAARKEKQRESKGKGKIKVGL